MAKTFTVAKNSFPDNLSNEEFATNVKEWLDGLSIGGYRRSVQPQKTRGVCPYWRRKHPKACSLVYIRGL